MSQRNKKSNHENPATSSGQSPSTTSKPVDIQKALGGATPSPGGGSITAPTLEAEYGAGSTPFSGANVTSPTEPSDVIIADQATPVSRKRGKSLSRRTGQNGHIEKSGRWYVVRYWKDVPGQDKRQLVRERICPITGPGRLNSSERKRKAREIIQASGVDTTEYFHEVVTPSTVGVTFRERSKSWLEESQNRKRKPIGSSYAITIQGALDKRLLPVIGDLPLGAVDNLTVKPLVDKMAAANLTPRTINKYVEFVKQVVASLKDKNGEPVHKKVWNAETLDLPVVESSKQKRPSLKADPISKLIQQSSDQEQALYVLLAATGMRVSEALALETRHFINNGRTIVVEQQVEKNASRIVQHLKTEAARREVDLHPDITEYMQKYMRKKTGLLFKTSKNTPHLNGNLESRWLTPRLETMGLDEKGMGFHAFKRFRKTWLRGQRCLEDINNFWMAHAPKTMSDLYSHLREELQLRLDEAERVGYGFVLPASNERSVVPMIPKSQQEKSEEVAA
jgi:integrase